MSSCANRNLFGWNSSPQSPPECIPYKRLEQTAPSWRAGQLKSSKSAKSGKFQWKPHYLREFLCDYQSVSTESKCSMDTTMHPIQPSWTDRSFLKRWSVKILKISKIGEMEWKTWISPSVLVRIGICFDEIQALDHSHNSSHTSFMNRPLLPEALASWNPQNQQNQQNGNENPEYLHEFLCESESVWTKFKQSKRSILHPIQVSWTVRSFLKRWPVEILKISKKSEN